MQVLTSAGMHKQISSQSQHRKFASAWATNLIRQHDHMPPGCKEQQAEQHVHDLHIVIKTRHTKITALGLLSYMSSSMLQDNYAQSLRAQQPSSAASFRRKCSTFTTLTHQDR